MEWGNVRDVLETAIGTTIVDITQDDWSEVSAMPREDRILSVYLHLSNGATLTFQMNEWIGFFYDGIAITSPGNDS